VPGGVLPAPQPCHPGRDRCTQAGNWHTNCPNSSSGSARFPPLAVTMSGHHTTPQIPSRHKASTPEETLIRPPARGECVYQNSYTLYAPTTGGSLRAAGAGRWLPRQDDRERSTGPDHPDRAHLGADLLETRCSGAQGGAMDSPQIVRTTGPGSLRGNIDSAAWPLDGSRSMYWSNARVGHPCSCRATHWPGRTMVATT
jgi:hypothetical protein